MYKHLTEKWKRKVQEKHRTKWGIQWEVLTSAPWPNNATSILTGSKENRNVQATSELRQISKYKEMARRLKEQFINGINDNMMIEITRNDHDKKTNEVKSKQVLGWANRVVVQSAKRNAWCT